MARLQKGHAMTVAVMATLCLIFGAGVSIVSWVISSKSPTSVTFRSDTQQGNVSFSTYWWGGLGFVIPGILGIIAGCTRNTCVMIFYLVFNILSLLASLAMSVFVAILIVAWASVDQRLNEQYFGGCRTIMDSCVCGDDERLEIWTLNGVTCDEILSLKTLLMALIALGAISTLLSFIASYVSCCSLCNQEQEPSGVIIQQAHQPGMVINQHSNYQQAQPNMGYAQQPPVYHPNYPPPQHQNIDTKDQAKLMHNEVI